MPPTDTPPATDEPNVEDDECPDCRRLGDIHCADCYIHDGKPFERDGGDELRPDGGARDDDAAVVRPGGKEMAALRKLLFGVTNADPVDDSILDAAKAFVNKIETIDRRLDAAEDFDRVTDPADGDAIRDEGGDSGG